MDPLCRRVLNCSGSPLAELDLLLADPDTRPVLLGHAGGALLQAAVDSLANPDSAGRLSCLTDVAERLVDSLPPAVSLAALLSRWRACQHGRPLAAVVRLTIRFLTGDRPAGFLLSGGADAAEDDAVSRWLTNLPTVAANRLASELPAVEMPDLLTRSTLGRLLSGRLVDCLAKGADPNRCARLAGLLCLDGQSASFWTSVADYSTVGRTPVRLPDGAVARLLNVAQPAHLESLLVWPLANCSNFAALRNYLGRNLVAKDAAASARLLLSDKLLFVRKFNNSLAARNIARYLHWADWALFSRTLLEAGRVWSQPAVVRSNGIEQHRHITWFLVVGARLLASDDTEQSKSVRNQLVTILVPGIAAHFEHNADAFRDIGTATGEVVTDLLRVGDDSTNQDDRRLKFDLPSCPDSDLIWRLAYASLDFAEDDVSLLGTPVNANYPLSRAPKDSQNPSLELEGEKKMSDLAPVEPLDSDDDEDLRPITASLATDGPAPDPNRPRYIRQLLEGLRSTAPEERDKLLASLGAARQLIAEHPGAVRELSLDLANALLNLNADSDDAVERFAEKRMAALTELVCTDPGSVATYLANQVFLPEYCTSQRLDALLALQTAALALSKSKPPIVADNAEAPRQTVGRVTRRWGRRVQPESAASANAFSRHAGAFFFGLARGVDTQAKHLDLAGSDFAVLCRLLYTLGVVYFCSENAPGQSRMLATLAELLPSISRHPEAPVRRGALFCYACLGLATPDTMTTELAALTTSVGRDLFDSIDNEPDAECRELAASAGRLLAGRLSEAWRLALSPAEDDYS